MIVIVIVTPGMAPPTSPAHVPIASGTRYCRCITSTRLAKRNENTPQNPVSRPRGKRTER